MSHIQLFRKQEELKKVLLKIRNSSDMIGFVPTMGALHNGHLSLIEASEKDNQITVVSIFVNPTQFNNSEDLKKYPRTLDADIQKIEKKFPNVLVYAPEVEDIYTTKTESKKYYFDGLEHQMEGKFRPGHFDGVGTIVHKLFQIVQPHRAYFGEKDFQQLRIIQKLVEKQKLNVEIIPCPILREKNGLAMSSRNERLSVLAREEAKIIYQSLQLAKTHFGTKSISEIKLMLEEFWKNHPKFSLEYIEIANEKTLKPASKKLKNQSYRAFIAVFIEDVRLIDTISLN
jgi:pantoate--beta-alanine ligase